MAGTAAGARRTTGARFCRTSGHRLANEADGAPRRREGRPVDHQERTQASLGHGPAAALREGALGARIWLQQPHIRFFSSPLRRRLRWAIWTSSRATTMQQREGERPEPLRKTIHRLPEFSRCRARRDVLWPTPGRSSRIAAEHGVTSSVQRLVNPAVRVA